VAEARFLAAARVDDVDRLLRLADELIEQPAGSGHIALLQCGRASVQAGQVASALVRNRRPMLNVVVKDRAAAQSADTLGRLSGASAVWVFADDLFETFMTVFATQLAFLLRATARKGLPVIGVGGGALALGGLMLANRVCRDTRYDLVSGLGWAPRVLLDGGAQRGIGDGAIARNSVNSLPGLLAIDLGRGGGVRVNGGRVESIGAEPIALFGGGANGSVLRLALQPGQVTRISPPPFAPFGTGLLPLKLEPSPTPTKPVVSQAPPPMLPVSDPEGGKICPMCHKVHRESRFELAA
jgi:hypothetical protein